MSLAKRKELAELESKTERISQNLVTHYNKLKADGIAQAKKDFLGFFTEHKFSITTETVRVPGHAFTTLNTTALSATFEKLYARLAADDNTQELFIASNIKGYGDLEYYIRVTILKAKSTGGNARKSFSASTEEAVLDYNIQQARIAFEQSEEAERALPESKCGYFLVTQTSRTNQGNNITHHREAESFTELLQYLFDS